MGAKKKSKRGKSTRIEILDFIRMILVCFVLVFICMSFLFRPVTVNGASMYPTLENGERGFSNVFTTFFSEPKRFEVVVVNATSKHENEKEDDLWVKRVIGLPGETLEYRDDKLYINGKHIKEDFLDKDYVDSQTEKGSTNFTNNYGPITLKEDEYFLVGDNRKVSKDSRIVGPFKGELIVSKYVLVLYPFDKIGYKK